MRKTVDDPRWETAERTDVRLRNAVTTDGEWTEPPTVDAVSFHVLVNDETAAFRFSWDDPSEERGDSADALALFFKPSGGAGDVVTLQTWPYEGAPRLDICYWSAKAAESFELLAASFEEVIERRGMSAALASAASYQ